MKTRILRCALLVLTLHAACAAEHGGAAVSPSPAVPGLPTSDVYTVTVNGISVWTERFRTHFDVGKFPEWFVEPHTRIQQEIHLAGFTCGGRVEVAVRVARPFAHAAVRPGSRHISTRVTGSTFTFTMAGPDNLVVAIDTLPPLFLFAGPPATGTPARRGPGIHYFGPGVHHPGYITLRDGESVYIAPGAIVYGGIRARGARHIRVTGRGILDGAGTFSSMVLVEDSHDVLFDGVMIRNGEGWTNTLVNCDSVRYTNARVLSFGPGCDGIDPLNCRHVAITGCFLRCTDDCIAVKAPHPGENVNDVLVSGNTMIGYAFSDGATIGFETNADSVSNVTVRDCDVLLARGGSRVDGHSAFSIICDGPSVISNVVFENIRVEESELKLFELNITDGTKYGTGPPGHIENILVKDVAWTPGGPVILRGFDDAHRVRNVTFENCTVAGKPLRDQGSSVMRVGGYVDNLIVR